MVGLIAGFGIYKGLDALFVAIGADLPKTGTVLATRTIIVSLLVGTIVTLLASILPARRATRVPPIAAVREGAELPQSRVASHSAKLAVGLIVASLAAICAGVFAGVGTARRRRAARRRHPRAVLRRGDGRTDDWSSRSRGWWAGRAGAPEASPVSWPTRQRGPQPVAARPRRPRR